MNYFEKLAIKNEQGTTLTTPRLRSRYERKQSQSDAPINPDNAFIEINEEAFINRPTIQQQQTDTKTGLSHLPLPKITSSKSGESNEPHPESRSVIHKPLPVETDLSNESEPIDIGNRIIKEPLPAKQDDKRPAVADYAADFESGHKELLSTQSFHEPTNLYEKASITSQPITITIGRLDIKAIKQEPVKPSPKSRTSPKLTLDKFITDRLKKP
jgi:hypothetical protein